MWGVVKTFRCSCWCSTWGSNLNLNCGFADCEAVLSCVWFPPFQARSVEVVCPPKILVTTHKTTYMASQPNWPQSTCLTFCGSTKWLLPLATYRIQFNITDLFPFQFVNCCRIFIKISQSFLSLSLSLSHTHT
jgi:hypothetical protein